MNSHPTLHFLSKSQITQEEYSQVNTLMELCQKEDQVNVKLELDFKLSLSNISLNHSKKTEFFCYDNNTLIAYL